ncbi:hypothetical protein H4219_004386 [Mycoemilia scoparia]|uniref:Glycosyl transferase family 25 domain-containing protein n=1 Tax=Mycoemilia scoparia TaxID=417184 RepID=A0A9W7ZZX6_9FUNG|nr:hypothetical protein H4219_004386 [Mycoemilia scoparia]
MVELANDRVAKVRKNVKWLDEWLKQRPKTQIGVIAICGIISVYVLAITFFSMNWHVTYTRKIPTPNPNSSGSQQLHKKLSTIRSPEKLYTDHIYAISLPESVDLRGRTQALFDLMGLDVEYVNGAGATGDLKHSKLQKKEKFEMSPKEFGIWQSHLKVWINIIERKLKTALILEDDIDFQMDVHSMVRKGLEIIDRQIEDREWDTIFVGHCANEFISPPIDAAKQFEALRKLGHPACTHAYIISQKGAQKFVELFSKNISAPIDLEIRTSVENGAITGYSYSPPLFTQRRDFDPFNMFKGEGFRAPQNSVLEFVKKYKSIYTANEIVDMGLA